MQKLYREYLDILAQCNTLLEIKSLPDMVEDEEIFDQIKANSVRVRELKLRCDEILQEAVFSRDAKQLTEEEVTELSAFADSLCGAKIMDAGIAYRIHQLLLRHAEYSGNRELTVRELYGLGQSLMEMNPLISDLGINPFGRQAEEYFDRCAAYLSEWRELDDERARICIIRSLLNKTRVAESINCPNQPCVPFEKSAGYPAFHQVFRQILAIYEGRDRDIIPPQEWEQVLFDLHRANCRFYFDLRGEGVISELIQKNLLRSAEYVRSYMQQHPGGMDVAEEFRLRYICSAICWRAGLCEVREVLAVLVEAAEYADPTDFTPSGIMLNLLLPVHLDATVRALPAEMQAACGVDIAFYSEQVRKYLASYPRCEFSHIVTKILGQVVRYQAQLGHPIKKKTIEYFLSTHLSTYIHVHSVAALSRRIFLRMVEECPEKLIGFLGVGSKAELLWRREELADRVHQAALCHDFGKILMMQIITIYHRSLLVEEFACIRLHSQIGAALLQDNIFDELYYVALYHHFGCSRKEELPAEILPCPPQYATLVDIVQFADALEAATDGVGRSYAKGKRAQEAVAELRSDPRFSGDIAALFEDMDFLRDVEQTMRHGRKEAYLRIYKDMVRPQFDTLYE